MSNPHADILIIGAGTAGCVLANRLTLDVGRQVMVLEAGGPDASASLSDPGLWPTLSGGRFDWAYSTEPQNALDRRVLSYPRGKGLGGSSSINALGHQRGHAAVFDGWAAEGCAGWGFADLLPFFKRSETFQAGGDAFRGSEGPLSVISPAADRRCDLAKAFVEAGEAQGHAFNADFNGASMAGVAWNQLAMRDGRRDSAATAYLHPALGRSNLKVMTQTQVLNLVLDRGRCIGARVLRAGEVVTIAAAETLLCAGAIDSPRLLLVSGVGDGDALRKLGVTPRINARGVGRNLQDHPLAGVVFAAEKPLPPSHYNHGEAILFAHSHDNPGPAPDIQIMTVDAPFTTDKTGPPPANGYSLVPCLMRPESRGTVALASSDPLQPARIDPNYLAVEADRRRFLDALDQAIALGADPAFATIGRSQVLPAAGMTDPAARLDYSRKAVSPFFHPVGTCRMGPDADSVADLNLKVRGIDGLRVVDASVMPTIPNAMPNAAILAIAEKAADLIIFARDPARAPSMSALHV